MTRTIDIGSRHIGTGCATYIIAEMSANHGADIKLAKRIVGAAADAGADAIKLQTYTADTLTIDCDNEFFRVGEGSAWSGRTLYDLYQEAHTPWEWHAELKAEAEAHGLDFFSTPFDLSAVSFLEELDVLLYKIASFEIVDIPLLRAVGRTGKPVIMSTGMASLAEIEEAVLTLQESGCKAIALLKCTSAYPAKPSQMNLRTIPHLADTFDVPVGLSDHTLTTAVPVAAVSLGASIVEKHLTLSRATKGPDSSFSLEPREFGEMVAAIRTAEASLGDVSYGIDESQVVNRAFRRSLFVVEDVVAGDVLTAHNVRSIRPGQGLHTRYLDVVLGRTFAHSVSRGTPLLLDMLR